MSSRPFMQLYVNDYLGDTRHLTTEQHGAYLLILMTMWRAGGELPNDDKKLARIAGLTPAKWRRIRDDIMDYMTINGDKISQKRITKEIKKVNEISSKRSDAGVIGGKAKARKTKEAALANAADLPPYSHNHISEGRKESKKDSEAKASAQVGFQNGKPKLEILDARQALFDDILPWLVETTNRPEQQMRGTLGKWLQLTGGDADALLEVCDYARHSRAADPVTYIFAVVNGKSSERRKKAEHPGVATFKKLEKEGKFPWQIPR